MPLFAEKPTILSFEMEVKPESSKAFVEWQGKLNAKMASFPGFLSLEFLSPSQNRKEWLVVQRFADEKSAEAWQASDDFRRLRSELQQHVTSKGIKEQATEACSLRGGVTEVIVTEVSPEQEEAFEKWSAQMHQAEAEYAGFRGVYLQSPGSGKKGHWITLLQFDTMENLDRWLQSSRRRELLKEGASLISSVESHRVISPYAGWFASIAKIGEIPPVWKQTMLVLLILFPIVMLELKFLSPLTKGLDMALATFIGNALSVSLIAFPMMPFVIRLLGWWLSPRGRWATLLGTVLVVALYLIEIALFWNYL